MDVADKLMKPINDDIQYVVDYLKSMQNAKLSEQDIDKMEFRLVGILDKLNQIAGKAEIVLQAISEWNDANIRSFDVDECRGMPDIERSNWSTVDAHLASISERKKLETKVQELEKELAAAQSR